MEKKQVFSLSLDGLRAESFCNLAKNISLCHSSGGWNPVFSMLFWIAV